MGASSWIARELGNPPATRRLSDAYRTARALLVALSQWHEPVASSIAGTTFLHYGSFVVKVRGSSQPHEPYIFAVALRITSHAGEILEVVPLGVLRIGRGGFCEAQLVAFERELLELHGAAWQSAQRKRGASSPR